MVCDTLLFDPKEKIIEQLGLTTQAQEINDFVKDLYMQGEEGIESACSQAVDDHL